MAGVLFYRGRQRILDSDGEPVSGAKLNFYLTGTTTPATVYSDADLNTAHSNPVEADSDGFVDPIYLAPDVTYKVVITDADDAALPDGTVDPVYGPMSPDVATQSSGTFTGTLTGMTDTTEGTVSYHVFGSLAGTGKLCVLRIDSALTGTSDANTMTMTGLPEAVQPSTDVWVPTLIIDNGNDNAGAAVVSGSTIGFYTDATLSASGFTSSGTKGLAAGWTLVYPL